MNAKLLAMSKGDLAVHMLRILGGPDPEIAAAEMRQTLQERERQNKLERADFEHHDRQLNLP